MSRLLARRLYRLNAWSRWMNAWLRLISRRQRLWPRRRPAHCFRAVGRCPRSRRWSRRRRKRRWNVTLSRSSACHSVWAGSRRSVPAGGLAMARIAGLGRHHAPTDRIPDPVVCRSGHRIRRRAGGWGRIRRRNRRWPHQTGTALTRLERVVADVAVVAI